jgi:hypothetical protein
MPIVVSRRITASFVQIECDNMCRTSLLGITLNCAMCMAALIIPLTYAIANKPIMANNIYL